jgi:uncharacterized protein HemX
MATSKTSDKNTASNQKNNNDSIGSENALTPKEELIKLRETNKSLRIWLIVLSVLVIAGLAGTLVFWHQNSQNKQQEKAQQEQIATLHKENTSTQQSSFEQQLKAKDETIAQQQKQIEDLQKQVSDLQNQNSDLHKQVSDLENQITDLENQIKSAQHSSSTGANSNPTQ